MRYCHWRHESLSCDDTLLCQVKSPLFSQGLLILVREALASMHDTIYGALLIKKEQQNAGAPMAELSCLTISFYHQEAKMAGLHPEDPPGRLHNY